MSIGMRDLVSASYPDPRYNYTEFELNSLPDPPPRYRMFGETAHGIHVSRRLGRDDLDALIKFHCYGINPGMPSRATNIRLIRVLVKLHYYMDDIHRPQTWGELCDTSRDAGPRLLSCSIDNPNLVPASRQYPRPPNPNAPARPGFVRPFYAANNIPDTYVERMLTVGPPGAGRVMTAATPTAAGSTPGPATDPTATASFLVPTPATPGPSTSPMSDPMTGVATGDNNVVPVGLTAPIDLTDDGEPPLDLTQPGPPPFMHTPQTGSFIRLPNFKFHDVVEAVERAVMQFAYADLERHPSAAPRAPRPRLLAGSQEDLYKSIVSSIPAAAKVGIADGGSVHAMVLDKNGYGFPYRGRGPVWRANSCAIDAAIVVGRLLDAGSTMYDRREPGWETRLSKAERAFIDVVDANWDVLSNEDSANLRDDFWRVLEKADPAIKVGTFNSMWSVWAAVATNIPQFQFSYVEALGHCPCRGAPTTNATFQASFVTPPVYPQDANGVTIQEVISRPFTPVQLSNCRECSNLTDSVTRERRLNNLPLRMVVTLDERVVIKNHTQDFSFDYCDINGQSQKATYRWLGGVYYHENHFRVLWTDSKRGEASAGEVLQYDGRQNSGLMVGGIMPHHMESRIPPLFWKDKPIPLLVYERVMNPEPDVLNTALQSMFNMVNSQMRNEPILQTHMPWKSTNTVPDTDASNSRPWDPIFPNYANRFHVAAAAYNPPQSTTTITLDDNDGDISIIDPPGTASNPMSVSPRMDVPQAFTADPLATLNSGAPISLPISVPMTQRLNQANSAHLPSAQQPSTPPQASLGLSPQGPYYFIPSPPQQQQQQKSPSPPWEEWLTSSCCGTRQPKVINIARKRPIKEVDDDSSSESESESEDEYRPQKKKAVSAKGKEKAVSGSKSGSRSKGKGKEPSKNKNKGEKAGK